MWWQALIPVLLAILEKWLKNREPKVSVGASPAAAFCTDEECDELATKLETALGGSPKGAVGHPGGVIAHLTDLVAALRSRDWAKIQTLLIDLLTHL